MDIVRPTMLILACVIFLVVTGCGTTMIEETHIFQARSPDGQINYYRVRICGYANLAKASYRAGLFDADAVNMLFNDSTSVSERQTVRDAITTAQRKSASALSKKFSEALSNPQASIDEIKKIAERLAITRLDPESVIQKLAPESAPREQKLVIILSALASIVEGALSNFAEEIEMTRNAIGMIAGGKLEDYYRAQNDLSRSKATIGMLKKVHKKMSQLLEDYNGGSDRDAWTIRAKNEVAIALGLLSTIAID